jgi:hypothetical protein
MPAYSIFISYAHEDEVFKNQLTQQLRGLQRQGLIAPWDDRCIDGGDEWRKDIDTALAGCHLALLLVSPAFIASDFIYAEELTRLLDRRAREGIRVVPIIVKPCGWKHEKPIASLQARPKDGKAILTFPEESGARAQAWVEIVDEIARWAQVHQTAAESQGAGPSESPSPAAPMTSAANRPIHAPSPRTPMTNASTILFLAASPDDENKLALDKEAREIRDKIRKSEYRDALNFRTEWAVRPDDLLQYLNEYRPQAVHFSGHGTASEILLLDANGQSKPVSREALHALFKLHSRTVRLVVLNACFSKAQAEAIVEVIDCAVGMNRAIGDEAAIVFAAAFYRKLGFGDSVKDAFEEARVALQLQGIAEHQTPELLVKLGVDPDKVFLVPPDHPR